MYEINGQINKPGRYEFVNKESLFDVINKTFTAMGRRFLKNQISLPLSDNNEINNRHIAHSRLLLPLQKIHVSSVPST